MKLAEPTNSNIEQTKRKYRLCDVAVAMVLFVVVVGSRKVMVPVIENRIGISEDTKKQK